MDPDRTAVTETTPTEPPVCGTQADSRPGRADGHPVRAAQRDSLEHAAAANGLRRRLDLLAAARSMATGRRLEAPPPRLTRGVAATGPARSGARRGRQRVAPRAARGKKTGPNPTDRRKAGSKHHVLTDAHGIPIVARLTAANRQDRKSTRLNSSHLGISYAVFC